MMPLQIGDLVKLVGAHKNMIGLIIDFELDKNGEEWYKVWFSYTETAEHFTADWLNKVS